jgi:hypothetical protein
MITKTKFHFLVHSPADADRFGPLLYNATERFESFNSIVRTALIHSNRQAPSRDAARTFAGFDRIKHIFGGGYWYDSGTCQWIRAGTGVRNFFLKKPAFGDLLNAPGPALINAGMSFWPVTLYQD